MFHNYHMNNIINNNYNITIIIMPHCYSFYIIIITALILILFLICVIACVLLVTGVLYGTILAEHYDQPGDPRCL
jgi:hypothetical protein